MEALCRSAPQRRAAHVPPLEDRVSCRARPGESTRPFRPGVRIPMFPNRLARIAPHIPLVILSNASNDQIHHNVAKLGAPFHAVFTAQQAQAYKPRLQAFEYMLDQLGCGPADILHVSSSLRYDLMSAEDLGVRNKVFVARGHEPSTPYYNYQEIKDIGGLPAARRSVERRALPAHEARILLARHRACLRERGAGRRGRTRRRGRSSAAVSRACPPPARWPVAKRRSSCWRRAASSAKPRGAMAVSATTASRTTTPPSHGGSGVRRRARSIAPTTLRSTRSSGWSQEERIDCDFVRRGRLKLAAKPDALRKLARPANCCAPRSIPNVQLVPRDRIRDEVGSDAFYGGLLQTTSAQMHVGKFGVGLAQAAARNGARIYESAAVSALERLPSGAFRIRSARGVIDAAQVLIATGSTSSGPFGWFQRRLAPVGSFIVVTEPLEQAVLDRLLPARRCYVTSRTSATTFGPRRTTACCSAGARVSRCPIRAPMRRAVGSCLRRSRKYFPSSVASASTTAGAGLVDMTADRLPRAGEHEGMYYSMGYSGHGVQMSVHMGEVMADVMDGRPEAQSVAAARLADDSRAFRQAMVPAAGRGLLPRAGHPAMNAVDANEGNGEANGVQRRDVLRTLVAAGVYTAVGGFGSLAHGSECANAKEGRTDPRRQLVEFDGGYARSCEGRAVDGLRASLHDLQRAHAVRLEPAAAPRACRRHSDQRSNALDDQAAQGRAVPQRQERSRRPTWCIRLSGTRIRRRVRR